MMLRCLCKLKATINRFNILSVFIVFTCTNKLTFDIRSCDEAWVRFEFMPHCSSVVLNNRSEIKEKMSYRLIAHTLRSFVFSYQLSHFPHLHNRSDLFIQTAPQLHWYGTNENYLFFSYLFRLADMWHCFYTRRFMEQWHTRDGSDI